MKGGVSLTFLKTTLQKLFENYSRLLGRIFFGGVVEER